MAQLPDDDDFLSFSSSNTDEITITPSDDTLVRPIYMDPTGMMSTTNMETALYVDGRVVIEGLPDDLKTMIEGILERLNKLERFYELVVEDAQKINEAVENIKEIEAQVED